MVGWAEVAPRSRPLIVASAATGVDAAISAAGSCPGRVFELAGVAPERIADPSLQLELTGYCRLIDAAANETGDDLFGARFGQHFTPRHFGAVGTLVMNAPTVLDGLRDLAAHYGWLQENSSVRLRRHGRVACLEYQIQDGRIARRQQDAELTIAALCSLIRHCAGPSWRPLEVHFEHGPGAARQAYEGIFRSTPCFDQNTNAVLVAEDALAAPVMAPDRLAYAAAKAFIRAQPRSKDKSEDSDGALGAFRYAIERQCKLGGPGIESVARHSGLSVHAFRQALRTAGLPFDELLSDVRRDLALRYLADPARPVTDIALLLGYSELSSFSRAFKRWTGRSPASHRKAVSSGLA